MKTPKYVTAKEFEIIHHNGLTPDKDYKVLEFFEEEQQVFIINDDGNPAPYHITHFYPQPTREEILPEKDTVAEEEESFDNLEYVAPEQYSYIDLYKLSEEQKIFLDEYFPWFDSDGCRMYGMEVISYDDSEKDRWCAHRTSLDYFIVRGKEVSFNDIFVEKQ